MCLLKIIVEYFNDILMLLLKFINIICFFVIKILELKYKVFFVDIRIG